MFGFLAKLIAGPLVGKLVDLFKIWQQNKLSEFEIRAEVEKVVLDTVSDVARTQSDVIRAEMSGENWLQRNWRPLVAISFAFIVFFYGLLMPMSVAWWGWTPVRVGDTLLGWIMDTVKLCLGGYIGGRSLEKIVQYIVRR